MKNTNITYSLASSLGVILYVSGVAWLMQHGQAFFGDKPDTIVAPIAMLSLFVFSAAITGSLVFGYPVWQFLNGKKTEAFKAFGWNLAFLGIFTVLAFVLMML
jgi:hypothetical protein